MSHFWMLTPPAMLIAWLAGSLSSAIWVCRTLGLPDPRTEGSGNPGTTNVLRIGGKKAAILTLLGDVLKGWLPVMLAKGCGGSPLTLSLVAFAAFLGHLYPVFFHFKGGKGVATAFGGLTALSFPLGLGLVITWTIVAMLFRYSSLAALVTAAVAPLYTLFLFGAWPALVVMVMSGWLIWRHKNNIHNLVMGQESRIGEKKARL